MQYLFPSLLTRSGVGAANFRGVGATISSITLKLPVERASLFKDFLRSKGEVLGGTTGRDKVKVATKKTLQRVLKRTRYL